MIRRATLLLTALALAACGSDAATVERPAGRPDPAAERRAVQERTAAYLRAYVGGDGPTACAQLSPRLRREIDERTRSAGSSCEVVLGTTGPALLEAVDVRQRPAFEASVTDPARIRVELAGRVARAGFGAAGAGRVPARLELERVGDRWLISRLGAQAPPTP